MERIEIENLVKTTLGELEKVLGSRTVVGEPIKVGDTTLIPLLSIGFGFGGAGGAGVVSKNRPEGGAGGGAAAGGVKPIAIIIIDKNGARIESIKGGVASALEKLGETVPEAISKLIDKWETSKKEG